MKRKHSSPYILWFDHITMNDLALVGGKNASLGEMTSQLKNKKIPIPYGFAITAQAYRDLLTQHDAFRSLKEILHTLKSSDTCSLEHVGDQARTLILSCAFSPELYDSILSAYHILSSKYKSTATDVAVRSSATAEDLPTASFAGQQESFLNITGEQALIEACKRCFASLFTNRAIAYRCEQGIDHLKTSLSIGVQKMVRSDLGSAGVLFTLDTETGFRDTIFITGSYGLGENVVKGAVDPDEFNIFKTTFKQGYKPLIKRVGSKETKIVYGSQPNEVQTITTPEEDRHRFCISDKEAFLLAKWALIIEEHYSKKRKTWTPMDIEWAKDGSTEKLYIVQARPETVQSRKNPHFIEKYTLNQKGSLLVMGKSVGNKMGKGPAHVLLDLKDANTFSDGEVLVTDKTDPDWVPIMRRAAAIVTNCGGRTSHAAIVSRELGLPCVVGAEHATQKIKTGTPITVDCTQEDKGMVYEGLLDFSVKRIDVRRVPRCKTKIMLNIGCPEEAYALSLLPNDGVGLAREEFIINEYIRIHPMALIHFGSIQDEPARKQIHELTLGYADKRQFFVDKLAMGIATIASAFYPRDVILRFSDFKTNEYGNLIGGSQFEPHEENPMIGWRGASRYYKKGYEEGFALECKAIKRVREQFGLNNLKVMIPVCRTPEEGKKVLETMRKYGLQRGKQRLEVYVMCEIPSNVILADQFCMLFDGFSIGSNDLTQMTLGVDRDSSLVADLFDERNEAVKRMIQHVISVAKNRKKKIGICGDAPSTYPEFARFLIDCGIDSISLSPDALLRMRFVIAKQEQKTKLPKKLGSSI